MTNLCTIADVYLDTVTQQPIEGAVVRIYWLDTGVQLLTGGQLSSFVDEATTDASGHWSITVPQAASVSPSTARLAIALPDRTKFAGVVPPVAGPLTMEQLLTNWASAPYSWGAVQDPNAVAVQTVQGSPAINWRVPLQWDPATTYYPLDGILYLNSTWRTVNTNTNSIPTLTNPDWAPVAISPAVGISVADYGADMTGVADSTTAVMNAITIAQATGCDAIYVPQGRIRVNGQVAIPMVAASSFAGGTTKNQFPVRLVGAGSGWNANNGLAGSGGTIVDLRYDGTGGNAFLNDYAVISGLITTWTQPPGTPSPTFSVAAGTQGSNKAYINNQTTDATSLLTIPDPGTLSIAGLQALLVAPALSVDVNLDVDRNGNVYASSGLGWVHTATAGTGIAYKLSNGNAIDSGYTVENAASIGTDTTKLPDTVRVATLTCAYGVTGMTLSSGGSNYTSQTVLTIASNTTGTGATAIPTIVGGVITGAVITNAGMGYSDATQVTVSISDPGGGSGAAVSAVSTAWVIVDSIDMRPRLSKIDPRGAGTLSLENICITSGNKGTWTSTTTYDAGDFVTRVGQTWKSLAANNLGNTPELSPTQWSMVTTFTDHVPFIRATRTTLKLKNVQFFGQVPATARRAGSIDAIAIGGTGSPIGARGQSFSESVTAASVFGGYGWEIDGCYFQNIRRALYLRGNGNQGSFTNNTIYGGCGADGTAGAIDFDAPTTSQLASHCYIAGNTHESVFYTYQIRLGHYANSNVLHGDNFSDQFQISILPTAGIAAWDSGTTYAAGAAVTYVNQQWTSLASNNLGNFPSTSPNWWSPVAVTGTGTALGASTIWVDRPQQVTDVASFVNAQVCVDTQDTQAIGTHEWNTVTAVAGHNPGYVLATNSGGSAVTTIAVPAYVAGTTYAQNAVVQSGGLYYLSLQNANTSNTPGSSPTWWSQTSGQMVLAVSDGTNLPSGTLIMLGSGGTLENVTLRNPVTISGTQTTYTLSVPLLYSHGTGESVTVAPWVFTLAQPLTKQHAAAGLVSRTCGAVGMTSSTTQVNKVGPFGGRAYVIKDVNGLASSNTVITGDSSDSLFATNLAMAQSATFSAARISGLGSGASSAPLLFNVGSKNSAGIGGGDGTAFQSWGINSAGTLQTSGNVVLGFNSKPDVSLTTLTAISETGGGMTAGTTPKYQVRFLSATGESLSSATLTVTLGAGKNAVTFANLPIGPAGAKGRRVYRSDDGGATYYRVTLSPDVSVDNKTKTATDATSSASLTSGSAMGAYNLSAGTLLIGSDSVGPNLTGGIAVTVDSTTTGNAFVVAQTGQGSNLMSVDTAGVLSAQQVSVASSTHAAISGTGTGQFGLKGTSDTASAIFGQSTGTGISMQSQQAPSRLNASTNNTSASSYMQRNASNTGNVSTYTVNTAGTSYVAGDTLTQSASSGSGTGFTATVGTTTGTITAGNLTITASGKGYVPGDTITLTNPHSGTQAVIVVSSVWRLTGPVALIQDSNSASDSTGPILQGQKGSTVIVQLGGAMNQSSGASTANAAASHTPVVTQSSSAGYTGLLVNVTETSTGSGAKNLLDLGTGGGTYASKCSVDNAGNAILAGGIALNGSTTTARPTITGSRGGNAALASLLTALAAMGLVTDSTTA